MEFKLAKSKLNAKNKTITLEDIEKEVEKEKQKIFYFDANNPHKDLLSLVEHFEQKGFSVYLREVRYGLDDDDFMYELHII